MSYSNSNRMRGTYTLYRLLDNPTNYRYGPPMNDVLGAIERSKKIKLISADLTSAIKFEYSSNRKLTSERISELEAEIARAGEMPKFPSNLRIYQDTLKIEEQDGKDKIKLELLIYAHILPYLITRSIQSRHPINYRPPVRIRERKRTRHPKT